MADVRPLRGVRYSARCTSLQDVVSAPYDVIGPAEAEALRHRSPYTSVHLDLPLPRAEGPDDRHATATTTGLVVAVMEL